MNRRIGSDATTRDSTVGLAARGTRRGSNEELLVRLRRRQQPARCDWRDCLFECERMRQRGDVSNGAANLSSIGCEPALAIPSDVPLRGGRARCPEASGKSGAASRCARSFEIKQKWKDSFFELSQWFLLKVYLIPRFWMSFGVVSAVITGGEYTLRGSVRCTQRLC